MAKKIETPKRAAGKAAPISSPAAEALATPAAPAPAPLKAGATAINGAPSAKPAKTAKATAGKKAAVSKTAAKAGRVPAKPKASFSSDDISLRAYFIAEHRHRHGVHGDEHSDWIEAERQLRAEHAKAAKSAKTPRARKPA